MQGAQLRKHIDATLGSGNLREAVKLPTGEDLNEWLAVNRYEAPLLRKLADKVAASGFYAVVPDFLHGEPFVLNDPNRPLQDKGTEEAKPVIEALKSKRFFAVGAAGFSWGVSPSQNSLPPQRQGCEDLQSCMDADVSLALKKAKLIKKSSLRRYGPSSSLDRTRTSVVNRLRKKSKDSMESFNNLRRQISSEYRETIQRRYFIITSENPNDKTVNLLISTGGEAMRLLGFDI
ncbi:hypothetical protein SO802_033765 [Lithocarpus litseifolius]|uniref:Syntaxin N-terminal domain-containing protein n=1 Tax=Lithocarpus litseifolius TaxID=425828 RepID=A0AAW2BJD3_9ROSI